MSRDRVLVTGGAGHQGKLLIPKLARSGFRVRAARRSPDKGEELRMLGAHEVFIGDLGEQETYVEALADVDVLYHIGPGGVANELEMGFGMLRAAKQAGVRHVVLSSVLHSIINILQHRYKRDIEEKLIESGLHFTILKPCDFMMPEVHVDPILNGDEYPIYWRVMPNRLGSLIDLHDLTDVALKVIREGSAHYGASYELSGPDKLTADDLVATLSRIVGRKISIAQKTPEELFAVLWPTADQAAEHRHEIEVLLSICAWYSEFDFTGNPNVLRWLLGRPPTTFEQFVRRTIAERRAGATDYCRLT
jgi:uncharacterized protein YbjT (DUF2867 family)